TTHFATVTVNSPDASVENQQTIRVGLYVNSAAPSDLSQPVAEGFVATSPVEPIAFLSDGGTDVTGYNVYTGAIDRTFAGVVAHAGKMVVSGDGQYLFVWGPAGRSGLLSADQQSRPGMAGPGCICRWNPGDHRRRPERFDSGVGGQVSVPARPAVRGLAGGAGLQSSAQQCLLRIRRRRAERTSQVCGRVLAISAAAVQLAERSVPQIIAEEPRGRFQRLEEH